MHWFAMFEAPKDGEIIMIRCTAVGIYLVYWGEIAGEWGWCDLEGGFSCHEDDCVGWLYAPAIEKVLFDMKEPK